MNFVKKHWTLMIFMFILMVLWLSLFFIYTFFDNHGEWTFWDMFSATNLLFSWLAFLWIIYRVWIQREELELQKQELKWAKEKMWNQNEMMQIQNFENIFFKMIWLLNKSIKDIYKVQDTRKLEWIYFFDDVIDNELNPKENDVDDILNKIYSFSTLEKYFKVVINVYKLIDEFENSFKEMDNVNLFVDWLKYEFSKENKVNFYTDLLSSQFSQNELIVLLCYFIWFKWT